MGRTTWHRRVRRAATAVVAVVCVSAALAPAEAQSLRGSTRSLDRQTRVARQHDYTYIASSAQLARFVDAGYLVAVRSNGDYEVHNVAFPYARAEVALFISRLARQYRSACGERLVVTSLTRPRSRQPGNASSRSVHPTGMALDLRRSNGGTCRPWLESVLLQLEGAGVLEATRERSPPHYHIAVFPNQYAAYVESIQMADAGEVAYQVRSGDSLWAIARRYGTTVKELRSANRLRGSRIYAGQLLTVPVPR